MKIVVYAIALNEAKHINQFMDSCADADEIIIADTGSTDLTKAMAMVRGAKVYDISIQPWRFDLARNTCLSLTPTDADCLISLDLDEVLKPGWRKKIETAWRPGTTQLRYRYAWGPNSEFFYDKIHSRRGYSWRWMCHEYICADPRFTPQVSVLDECLVEHRPDQTKSRAQYLDMLRAQVIELPDCSRSRYYLTRELWYCSDWSGVTEHGSIYLTLRDKTQADHWHLLFMLSQSAEHQGNQAEAEQRLLEATKVYPEIRDPWIELSKFYQKQQKFHQSLQAANQALAITNRIYVHNSSNSAWQADPWDLVAVASYYIKKYDQAIFAGQKALRYNPTDARLQKNLEFYYQGANHGLTQSNTTQESGLAV